MTKNFLCLFSIKRMWELLETLRSRWAFYFSEVVPSWGQQIEMSTTLHSRRGYNRLICIFKQRRYLTVSFSKYVLDVGLYTDNDAKSKSGRQQLQHCTTQTNPKMTFEKFGHPISSSSRVDKRLQVVMTNEQCCREMRPIYYQRFQRFHRVYSPVLILSAFSWNWSFN